MAVRRAITPYAGIVPPTASSTTLESSKASEAQSLQSLESLASCDLDSGLDSDEDVVQVYHSVPCCWACFSLRFSCEMH